MLPPWLEPMRRDLVEVLPLCVYPKKIEAELQLRMMIFLQDRRECEKRKETELEKPTGICTKLSLRIKRKKEEGRKDCVKFSLLHGHGGNEEDLIPLTAHILKPL